MCLVKLQYFNCCIYEDKQANVNVKHAIRLKKEKNHTHTHYIYTQRDRIMHIL